MLTTSQLSNLGEAAQAAYECERQTSIPCEFTLAQWALESGWGSHSPGNNCFGIKNYEGAHGTQVLPTKEWFTVDEFLRWKNSNPLRSATVDTTAGKDVNGRFRYCCQDIFATFPILLDCFLRRSGLLQSGYYANVLGTFKVSHDLIQYIDGVARSYATDPTYPQKILDIIQMPEVIQALKSARGGHQGATE